MTIRIGPILHALQNGDADTWRFTVQVTVDTTEAKQVRVTCSDPGAIVGAARKRDAFKAPEAWTVLAFPVTVTRAQTEKRVSYSLDGLSDGPWTFDNVAIPALGLLPRIAGFSCNWFMHSKDQSKVAGSPTAMWAAMADRHRTGLAGGNPDDPSGFHLLVGGGDQVYADDNQTTIEANDVLVADRAAWLPTKGFAARAVSDFVRRYASVFTKDDMSYMMARVPAVHTWDDHDIMDGWGSFGFEHAPGYEGYKQIFEAAKRTFEVFQLDGGDDLVFRGSGTGPGTQHYLQWLKFRESTAWFDVILLDLRTHRTPDRVLSPEQLAALSEIFTKYESEAAKAPGVKRHVLIVSSIPLVYLHYSDVELRAIGALTPSNVDDVRDQWEHPAHQGERTQLIMRLLDFRKKTDSQVTVLSGDVHVAGVGHISSELPEHIRQNTSPAEQKAVMIQIISSAIVNAPPSQGQTIPINVGDSARRFLTPGISTELINIDNNFGRLVARNFVSLAFDPPEKDRGLMWVEWISEDQLPLPGPAPVIPHRKITRQFGIRP